MSIRILAVSVFVSVVGFSSPLEAQDGISQLDFDTSAKKKKSSAANDAKGWMKKDYSSESAEKPLEKKPLFKPKKKSKTTTSGTSSIRLRNTEDLLRDGFVKSDGVVEVEK